MEEYVSKPDLIKYKGMRVDKNTKLEYKSDNLDQLVEDLTLVSKMVLKTDLYESETKTTVFLKEGDILLFEDGGRGYIKPVEEMITIDEAIEELKCIK